MVLSVDVAAQEPVLLESDSSGVVKAQDVEEVMVKVQRPVVSVKTDKVTYQVQNDAEGKTRTMLEILRKVPMVTVDGRGNITVNGSSQFKVYVDGRLNNSITRNPTQMLRNMPASNVKNIEVLTNPGASYDAEGAGGVLSITTTKGGAKQLMAFADEDVESATQGSVHATAGTKMWGLDASLSSQRDRWSYDVNMNGEYMYSPNSVIESEVIGNGTSQKMRQKSKSHMPFGMCILGAGYEIDSIRSMHGNLSLSFFGMKDEGNPSYNYQGKGWGNGMMFSGKQMTKMNEMSVDGSIDYMRQIGDMGKVFINYQLSHAPGNNESENHYYGLGDVSSDIVEILKDNSTKDKQKSTSHTLMTDVTLPFTESQLLNTGIKMTADRSESDAQEKEFVGGNAIDKDEASLHYRQHQYIAAVYTEWNGTWERFSTKNGIRYEHTWQDSKYVKGEGSDFSINYADVVPSFSVSLNLKEGLTLGANYNRRIRRARINELDPYVNHSDPTRVSCGNPHLDAQHLNYLALVATLTRSKVAMRMSINHSWSNDGITQYSKMVDGVISTTYGNILKNKRTSFNGFLSCNMRGGLRLMVSGEVGYADMSSKEIDAHNSGWSGSTNVGVQYSLPFDIKWNTNLEWMSEHKSLQGNSSGMTMLSTAISRSFCKEKLNISLSGMTGLGHGGKMVWETVNKSKEFTDISRYIDNMQDITIGISWTFGATKSRYEEPPMFDGSNMGGTEGNKMMRRRGR